MTTDPFEINIMPNSRIGDSDLTGTATPQTAMTSSLPHFLQSSGQLKWTATQLKAVSREYPFSDIHNETSDQFVERNYLQFLWLPEVLSQARRAS